MIKKILSILFVAFLSLTIVNPTYASIINGFSDTETSTNNSFSASTLFFFITDTADNPLPMPYFDISDMKPGDSQSKTIRIKKGGLEDFKYNLSFSKTNGEDKLCNALKIEVKLESTTVYNGSLSTVTINPIPTISSSGTDQIEIIISLSDSSSDLKNINCSYDLTFKGWQTTSDGSWGFKDSHSFNNNTATGTWEESISAPSQVQNANVTETENLVPTTDITTNQIQDNSSLVPDNTISDPEASSDTPTITPTPDDTSASDNSNQPPSSDSEESTSSDSSSVPETNGGG